MRDWKELYESTYKECPDYFGLKPHRVVEQAAELLSQRGRVLDLGAGNGRHTFYLVRLGFEVVATDVAESSVQIIRERAREYGLPVVAMCGDASDGLPVGGFDLICICSVLHYFSPEIGDRVLTECMAAVNPGGILAMIIILRDSAYTRSERCAERYFPEAGVVGRQFEQAGWILEVNRVCDGAFGDFTPENITNKCERIIARKPH